MSLIIWRHRVKLCTGKRWDQFNILDHLIRIQVDLSNQSILWIISWLKIWVTNKCKLLRHVKMLITKLLMPGECLTNTRWGWHKTYCLQKRLCADNSQESKWRAIAVFQRTWIWLKSTILLLIHLSKVPIKVWDVGEKGKRLLKI